MDQTNNNSDKSDAPRHIERAILGVQRSAQRSLSQWTKRYSPPNGAVSPRRDSIVAASTKGTQRLLQRIQRQTDKTTAVNLNLGNIQPGMVSRFTDSIANRFLPLMSKHQPGNQMQRKYVGDENSMPLADGSSHSDIVPESSSAPVFTGFAPGSATPSGFGDAPSRVDTGQQSTSPSGVPNRIAPQGIQRTPEETRTVLPRVSDLRATMESKLIAARSAQNTGPAKVVNPPRPSLSQIRRVARVEEVDPISLASRNELQSEGIPITEQSPVKSTVSGDDIRRKTVESQLDIPKGISPHLQSGTENQTRGSGLTNGIQRRSEPETSSISDESAKPPVQRKPAEVQSRAPVQVIHTTEAISQFDGEVTPLQRMRQARERQIQRSLSEPATDFRIFELPVTKVASVTEPSGLQDTEEPSSPVFDRQMPRVEPIVQRKSNTPISEPPELRQGAISKSVEEASPSPLSAPVQPKQERPSVRRKVEYVNTGVDTKPSVGESAENIQRQAAPELNTSSPKIEKIQSQESSHLQMSPEVQVPDKTPQLSEGSDLPTMAVISEITDSNQISARGVKSDSSAITTTQAGLAQRSVERKNEPDLVQRDTLSQVEPEVEVAARPSPASISHTQLTSQEPALPDEPKSVDQILRSPGIHPSTQASSPGVHVQRKESVPPAAFEQRAINRVAKHLDMPLTRRTISRKPVVSRPVPSNVSFEQALAPIDQPSDTNITEPPTGHASDNTQVPPRSAVAQVIAPIVQRSEDHTNLHRTANPPRTNSVSNNEIQRHESTDRLESKPENSRTQMTEVRSAIGMPFVQRSVERSMQPSLTRAENVVLPQVREVMETDSGNALSEQQPVTGEVLMKMSPTIPGTISRMTEASIMRMPLLQRSSLRTRADTLPSQIASTQIQRLTDVVKPAPLVLRQPAKAVAATVDTESKVRRKKDDSLVSFTPDQQAQAPGISETRVIRPNLDELAVSIMPLIKRMLSVERERQKGL